MPKRKVIDGQPQLTLKEKVFANEVVRTKSYVKAAALAYDVKSREQAYIISQQVKSKPIVRNYIEQALKDARYEPVKTIQSLMHIESEGAKAKASVSDSLKASEHLLKLSGALQNTSKSVNLNIDIDNLDTLDLLKMKQKYDKLLNS